MTYFATLDILELALNDYRRIVDEMGVERNPSPHILLHVASEIDGGVRVNEIWDSEEAFQSFLSDRLFPAASRLGIQRDAQIAIRPLVNIFAPRLSELPGLAANAPAGPHSSTHSPQ